MAISPPSDTATLQLRTLGGIALEGAGEPLGGAGTQRKGLALLAFLACAGTRSVSRDKLLALLWPEAAAERARHRLTQLLYSLRHDLGTPDLFLGAAELRLNRAVLACDLDVFGAALVAGDLEHAVAAYTGPFLDGFFLSGAPEFERWVELERSQLARQYATALEKLAHAAARSGDHQVATRCWQELAEADPLNSRVTAAYVESVAAAGDRAGALRAAQSHQALLRQELDTGPTTLFQEAVERVRAGVTPHPTSRATASIAVLPFLNLTPERENEYFSDGITEELTNALARLPGLRVVSRTSAFTFKGRVVDAREIGEQLGVKVLVEGSVRKVGDRIRLTAQLVNAADGYHLWSDTYERTLTDVFQLQEQLATTIARELPLGRSANLPAMTRSGTHVVEAYTLYLRGRYFAQRRTVDGLRVALEYFEQATERDPSYALAYAGIAECWCLLGFEEFGDVPPHEAMPRAKAAADRALAIDPLTTEGHHWSGVVAFLYEYDWPRAEAGFQRALKLSPHYSLAHTWYALLLSAVGRHEEAVARIGEAEALDPLSFSIQTVLGHVLYFAGRYDEAVRRLRALLDIEPNNPRALAWLAGTYMAMGRPQDALAVAERAIASSGRRPSFLMSAGVALAKLGRESEAQAILAELSANANSQYVSPSFSTPILLALGLKDETMLSLRRLLEERSGHLAFLRSEPRWSALHSDPVFQAFLAEICPTK
jgi:TolB-like protein/Flp pilus assembly protein TadD